VARAAAGKRTAKRTASKRAPAKRGTVAALKALADPLRLQILIELLDPKTVKEVAAVVGGSPTRLYYHVNILEKAGLIRVVSRRKVSGIEERRYRTVERWSLAPDMTASLVTEGIVKALMDVVRAEVELALLAKTDREIGEPGSPVVVFGLSRLALSVEEAAELQGRIEGLLKEFGAEGPPGPGRRLHHALFAAYLPPAELKEGS
jgi:DNA-binding transcriptional ArsR family regulator